MWRTNWNRVEHIGREETKALPRLGIGVEKFRALRARWNPAGTHRLFTVRPWKGLGSKVEHSGLDETIGFTRIGLGVGMCGALRKRLIPQGG